MTRNLRAINILSQKKQEINERHRHYSGFRSRYGSKNIRKTFFASQPR